MDLANLNAVAEKLVAPGKGLLAADESTGTIKKRFDSIGLQSTPETRRDYREMLLGADEAMQNYVSGVILFEETLHQHAADATATPLVALIERAGAVPGIKVDKGTTPLAGFPGETITQGLDGLGERLDSHRAQGAWFAKWRAVIDIAAGVPTWAAIKANAHALARYAALCQAHGLAPIVEPEVLMDGDHGIEACEAVTRLTLKTVFQELFEQRVALEGMVLKPNMVVAGAKHGRQVAVEEVARRTLAVLKDCVPCSVPGIAFLSGGQSAEEATAHLDAMNRMGPLPWKLTFSYGRALQHAPLTVWAGRRENVAAAQRAFAHRARMNSLASLGRWEGALEQAA
ncbi:MAG TPA: class I fructose-bisphosphate aldolase [Caulobacteraceae bacterium]|nr:class I fructose-bisphosphate aldolase [Caulobacteraceae bacterium]